MTRTYLETIIIEPHLLSLMPRAAHIDDPRALLGREQLGHDQIREQEMSDMVSGELGLQPVNALRIRHGHDGRIIDQSVDGLSIRIDFLARLADLILRAEVELEEPSGNGRRGGLEGCFRGLQFGQVAAGEDQDGGAVMG